MSAISTEIEIRQVSFSGILASPMAKELLDEYAAECSLPELGEICPQSDLYRMMENGDSMRTFGVFNGERLIGFAALLVYVLPHYGKKVAATESIFVTAEHRKTGAGKKLLDFIESYARELGCAAVLYTAPTQSQFASVLGLQPKYRHSNDVFIGKLA